MMRELTSLWSSLHQPEYLHLLLEPLALFGLAAGFLFLVLSLFVVQSAARIMALLLILLSAGSVHWYLGMRVKSEPRIAALMDSAFHPRIREQTTRRKASEPLYIAIAAVAAVALAFGRSSRSLFVWAAAIMAAVGVVHATWLHKKECEVFHPNIVHYAAPQ